MPIANWEPGKDDATGILEDRIEHGCPLSADLQYVCDECKEEEWQEEDGDHCPRCGHPFELQPLMISRATMRSDCVTRGLWADPFICSTSPVTPGVESAIRTSVRWN